MKKITSSLMAGLIVLVFASISFSSEAKVWEKTFSGFQLVEIIRVSESSFKLDSEEFVGGMKVEGGVVVVSAYDVEEAEASGFKKKEQIDQTGFCVLSVPAKTSVEAAILKLSLKGIFAEPDYLIPVQNYASQWPANYSLPPISQRGGEGIIVAVVDTGVDYLHPDLAPKIWHNPGEVSNNGADDDGNGYADDILGWNFVSNNGNIAECTSHGTVVAGVIAGVAPGCQIMSVAVGLKNSSGIEVIPSSAASKGIIYAALMGADVINLSWGCQEKSFMVEAAVNFAIASGSLVCAAVGNYRSDVFFYPAALPGVLSVGALSGPARAFFSNYGPWVNIYAPGVNVLTTCHGGGHGYVSGTSIASPFVAGVAASLWSLNKVLTNDQIKTAILAGGQHVNMLTSALFLGFRFHFETEIAGR